MPVVMMVREMMFDANTYVVHSNKCPKIWTGLHEKCCCAIMAEVEAILLAPDPRWGLALCPELICAL